MLPAEFEPALPTSERPQIHPLDRAVAGSGDSVVKCTLNTEIMNINIYKHISTLLSESRCTLTEGVGSDVHERLYRPEQV
jgi:hypothetical protein